MLYIEATPSDTSSFVSRAALLRRGWTPGMIRDLLDPPEQTRTNPVVPSRAPMRLYSYARVLAAEDGEEFRVRSELGRARARLTAESVTRRREQALAVARAAPVDVPVLPLDELTERAVAHEQARPLTEDRLHGWQLAYLTDQLPPPEETLAGLASKVGRPAALRLLRARIAEAIGDAYPWLAARARERMRQPSRRRLSASASSPGRHPYPPPPPEATSAASS